MGDKRPKASLLAEEELQRQFKEAQRRGAEVERSNLRAVTVTYDKRTKRLMIEIMNGVVVSIPVQLVQGLADASPRELDEVTLSPRGTALHWEKLDVDHSVSGLLAGVFGTQA